MLSYLFSKLNKITEKQKGKIKQKKEKNLPGAQARGAHPAQPAHKGRGVFFPAPRTQAARWNATEPAGRPATPPACLEPSRRPYRALETRTSATTPLSPSIAFSSSSCARFLCRQEPLEHRREDRVDNVVDKLCH